jgi:hypothetical protein
MPDTLPPLCRHTLICRHITFFRHSAAGAEAQVTALLERVKELTGMPVSADLFITAHVLQILYFFHCFSFFKSLF